MIPPRLVPMRDICPASPIGDRSRRTATLTVKRIGEDGYDLVNTPCIRSLQLGKELNQPLVTVFRCGMDTP